MHLLGERTLGIVILLLLAGLVVVKRFATGSVLDRPRGGLLVQAVNVFNLFFLLVANPLAAVLLVTSRLATSDPTNFKLGAPGILVGVEIVGLALYVAGYFLMARALIVLARNYQLGGCAPRAADRMIVSGPYRLIRHPMYSAALSIALGLTCLIQSWAAASVLCVYLVLISLLIPLEEAGLQRAYGDAYVAYQRNSKKLIPLVY
jgi:protein-S-isoprenylcysteine O-methyltransferase Ste14